MRIHHLQHVPFEGLGTMESFFLQKGHQLSSTHFYLGNPLPSIAEFDWLIVMGGPMGVYDEIEFPWLKEEKSFIRESIESGKIVLGICLGAQLIADALGARVFKNQYREIGWFPIDRQIDVKESAMVDVFPDTLEVFHWHGDTFETPKGAKLLASSEACRNQGFVIDNRVVGLQFHLETTSASAAALIENCHGELDGSKYVQSAAEIQSDKSRFLRINGMMYLLLAKLEKQNS
ncbi:Glutamine amidotransferase, class I [Olavius sp. associated proteobacterium Delta 1]|nr:Glutamine amidotransferase, class I [Olavius sp. associated proteobacterium Delta 1]